MTDVPAPDDVPTDDAVEQLLGRILQLGVGAAAAIAMFGAVVFYARHAWQPASYRAFIGEPADLRSIDGVVHGVLAFRSRALIQAGLLVLIATPIARVALSLVAFARQRDWLYVGITAIVLALLLASLTIGAS